MTIRKMRSSKDPDEMPHYERSHFDLHCSQFYLNRSTRLKRLLTLR